MTKRSTKALLILAAAIGFAQFAHAQNHVANGEVFIDYVKEFNGAKAMAMLRQPGNNLVNYRNREGDAALHIAVRGRKHEWVEALYGFKADIDIRDSAGDTPLALAIKSGQTEMVIRLLSYGANVDVVNRSGETPLIHAVRSRQVRIVELLLERGADPDAKDNLTGLSARDYAQRDSRNPKLLELIESTETEDQFQFGPILR